MNELQHIAEHLRWTFDGDAWHGPAVMEALAGVTATQAAARPIAGAHSIWELVHHMTTWKDVVRRRIDDEVVRPTDDEDWPKVGDTSAGAWRKTIDRLRRAHDALVARVEKLGVEELDRVPPKGSPIHRQVHGVIHHDVYHAGQIVILKKAFGAGLP